jgi:hypothetical protein
MATEFFVEDFGGNGPGFGVLLFRHGVSEERQLTLAAGSFFILIWVDPQIKPGEAADILP